MIIRNGYATLNLSRSAPPVRAVVPPPPSPDPKVLMLVLASDTQPIYLEHQRLWRTYMHTNPNVDCYFYKGDPTMEEEAKLDGDTLFLKIKDTLETVYEKTLRAFDFFAPRLKDYKCVFRTNLSSVVVLDRYVKACRGFPDKDFCSAFIGDPDSDCPFPAGAGFTLSPDLVLRLIEERPPLFHQDDLTIGKALRDWGIKITPAVRADFIAIGVHETQNHLIGDHVYHFRIKQNMRHIDGIEIPYELDIMQKLISQYYDDPPTRRIEVVFLMAETSASETVWQSIQMTCGPNVYFSVLFNGDPTEHWIRSYDVSAISFKDATEAQVRDILVRYLHERKFPDNTIVYVAQDTQMHHPGWATTLRKRLVPAHYCALYTPPFTVRSLRVLPDAWGAFAKTVREDTEFLRHPSQTVFSMLHDMGRKIVELDV